MLMMEQEMEKLDEIIDAPKHVEPEGGAEQPPERQGQSPEEQAQKPKRQGEPGEQEEQGRQEQQPEQREAQHEQEKPPEVPDFSGIKERLRLPRKYSPRERERESRIPLILSSIALLVSIISLVLVLFNSPSPSGPDMGELSAIADDVRAIRDSSVVVSAPIGAESSLDATIPVSEAMESTIQIPVKMAIPLTGTVAGTAPWGTVVQIPVSGEISTQVVANMTLGRTSQKIRIRVTVPSNTTASFTLAPSQYWGEQLDSIIERLEALN